MKRYSCCFMDPFLNKLDYVEVSRMSDVTDGFWLNSDYEFTRGSDCKYWIPPSQIRCVEVSDDL